MTCHDRVEQRIEKDGEPTSQEAGASPRLGAGVYRRQLALKQKLSTCLTCWLGLRFYEGLPKREQVLGTRQKLRRASRGRCWVTNADCVGGERLQGIVHGWSEMDTRLLCAGFVSPTSTSRAAATRANRVWRGWCCRLVPCCARAVLWDLRGA